MAEDSVSRLRVPLEIIEAIVDMTVSTMQPKTLSSMALVSRFCRMKANRKRFSTIYSNRAERFRNLVSIFKSQHRVRRMQTMASFIVSFHYRRGAASDISDPFLDGDMAVALNLLFRPSPDNQPSSKDFVLNLDPSGDDNVEGHYWHTFHPSITPAFMNICYNSRLTELSLFNIQDVPSGILRYSTTIKHLRLDHVSAADSKVSVTASDSQIALESLHVYAWVLFEDIMQILCGRTPVTPTTLSALKELRTVLCTFEDVYTTNELFTSSPDLEVLSLSVRQVDPSVVDHHSEDGMSIRLQHLTSLKRVFLLNLFDARVDSGIVPEIIVGGQVPPSLEEINIFINDWIDSDEATDLFQYIDLHGIDELFSRPQMKTVKRFVIIAQVVLERRSGNYRLEPFKERCIDYVRTKMPRLSSRMLLPCIPALLVSVEVITL